MIYLDNAATSYPKPQIVRDAVNFCFGKWGGNPGRSGHALSIETASAVYEARETIARFIGSETPEQIIFTSNATHALNIAIRGSIEEGEHILISDLEHNAVYRPLWYLKESGKITFSLFSHKGDVLENIRKAITPQTRHIIATHVSNVNGSILPIKDIGELCKSSGIFFIVDASQSLGHIALSLKDFYCDVLCASGHKGMMGIQGAGILYLKDAEKIRPMMYGGSGAHSLDSSMPSYIPDKYEAGTLATPAIVSLGAGVGWLEAYTLDSVEAEITAYNNRLYSALLEMKKIHLCSDRDSCILSFGHDSISSEDFANQLDEKGICVRGGIHCAPLAHQSLGTLPGGLVRISPSIFSSEKAIPYVIDSIYKIAKGRP